MPPQPAAVLAPEALSLDLPAVDPAVQDPRTRILDAAAELFYAHGVQQVGMDQLCTAAGVSLKRTYREFPSKDQLIEAYLRRRSRQWLDAAGAATAGVPGGSARIVALVDWLAAGIADSGYRGCPFGKVVGELGGGYLGVCTIAGEHKAAWRRMLVDHAAAVTGPDRPEAAGALADRLHLLTEGLLAATAVSPDDGLVATARATAGALAEQYSAAQGDHRPSRRPGRRRISDLLRRIRGPRR